MLKKLFILALFLFNIKAAISQVKYIEKADSQYDVVIVGGGISGISAALSMGIYKVLIIEKEAELGGRIKTKQFEDIYYDMGAAFAFDSNLIPAEFNYSLSPLIVENKFNMLIHNNQKYECEYMLHCMLECCFSESEISVFLDENVELIDFSRFSTEQLNVINTLFNLNHAGKIQDYVIDRQRDFIIPWSLNHYVKGNKEIVNAYSNMASADVLLKATVNEVEQLNDGNALVTYTKNGVEYIVKSKAVLLTTTAPTTKKLVKQLKSKNDELLSKIMYKPYSVIAVGVKDVKLPDFKYIATVEDITTNILIQQTQHKNKHVLFFNYCGDKALELSKMNDEDLLNVSLQILEKHFNVRPGKKQLMFYDVEHWTHSAVQISPDYYNDWTHHLIRPSQAIFLAGDYLEIGGFPSGIKAATITGFRAAELIKRYFAATGIDKK